jgi:hypothetical protein
VLIIRRLSRKMMDNLAKAPQMLRKASALTLIFLLLSLALTAWQRGLADIHAARAQSYIRSWWKGGKTPNDEEWEKVRNILDRSLARHHEFPPYIELLGTINLTRSLNILLDETEAEKARLKAEGYFRDVVKARPSWPYAWANILWIKSENGDYDEEFFHALDRSMALGSWESKVQRIVTDTTLSAWNKLDEATRQKALQVIAQALHRQSKQIIELANFYGSMEIICPLLTSDQKLKYCQHTQ